MKDRIKKLFKKRTTFVDDYNIDNLKLKNMSKYLWLIDPGHGGIINGKYQTEGKRSPEFDGKILYEGVFNREVANSIKAYCNEFKIDSVIIPDGEKDTSLFKRVQIANKLAKTNNCIYISIHANAGGGTGFEIFTSPGETKSDPIASDLYKIFEKEFPELKPRKDYSDNDPDKEAPFYVLTKTNCPAILVECAFMDTYEPDWKLLSSHSGVQRFANAIKKLIKQYER